MAISPFVRCIQACPSCLRPALRTLVFAGALVVAAVRTRRLIGWRGKIRRLYLLTCKRNYIRRQLAQRQGLCNQCGACCRLGMTCPFLDENLCVIYDDRRPTVCCVFPLNDRDLAEVDGQCSYAFEPQESPVLVASAAPGLDTHDADGH